MNAKDVIRTSLTATQHMLHNYLSDLSDADLLVRPISEANHIAWQLGHLIASERQLVTEYIPQAACPELPAGFAEQHKPEASKNNPPKGFASKAEYLSLFDKMRGATLATLAKLSDADLDKATTGQMAQYAPTVAAMFVLLSNHDLMHAGQFSVVRRKLGKPILF